MNRSVWARAGVGAAVAVVMALGGQVTAHAAEGDPLSLKFANALRGDRLFMRAGAIYVKIKTKSGDTYDVTGPVVKTNELEAIFGASASSADIAKATAGIYVPDVIKNTSGVDITLSDSQKATLRTNVITALRSSTTGVPLLIDDLSGQEGIGTPTGLKGEAADSASTAGVSIGLYLDDEHKWAAETYILAAPISTSSIVANGTKQRPDPDTGGVLNGPLEIGGKKILTTKLLPPTVILGRYWGDKNARLRVFTGGMATYAMFYDTKATDYLNSYVGGSNPGDTTVSLKNTFGLGPTLGFRYKITDDWHASLNIGHVKLKTQATIATRNTMFNLNTKAIQDLGMPLLDTITTAEGRYAVEGGTAGTFAARQVIAANGGVSGTVMKAVASYRGQENLGTYVRKNDLTLTSTLFMLSVGRSF